MVRKVFFPLVPMFFSSIFQLASIFIPRRWIDPFIPIDDFTAHELFDVPSIYAAALSFWWVYCQLSEKIYFRETFFMLLGLITMIEGHGSHMVGNALHRILEDEHKGNNPQAYQLNYFFDEVFGHFLWYLGEAICWLVLVERELKAHHNKEQGKEENEESVVWQMLWWTCVVLQGVLGFFKYVEGQSVPLGTTFCLLVLALPYSSWVKKKEKKGKEVADSSVVSEHNDNTFSILHFLWYSSVLTVMLLCGWCWWHGGHFPEFRVLGLGTFRHWPGHFLTAITKYMQGA